MACLCGCMSQQSDSGDGVLFVSPGVYDFSLTVLDVGQGRATLLRQGEDFFLIDGGGDSLLTRRLEEEGVHKLEWVLISHWDLDHFSGIAHFLSEGGRVGHFLLGPDQCDSPQSCDLWEKVRLASHQRVLRNDTLPGLGGDLSGTVLWPPDSSYRHNQASVVVRLHSPEGNVLLTADADSTVETWLLEREGKNLQVQVLEVAHHGSASSTSLQWLLSVQPQLALVSVGENSYGHPHPDVLGLLYLLLPDSTSLLRTDLQGTVHLNCYAGVGWIAE